LNEHSVSAALKVTLHPSPTGVYAENNSILDYTRI